VLPAAPGHELPVSYVMGAGPPGLGLIEAGDQGMRCGPPPKSSGWPQRLFKTTVQYGAAETRSPLSLFDGQSARKGGRQ
jgi:hypothetical protein